MSIGGTSSPSTLAALRLHGHCVAGRQRNDLGAPVVKKWIGVNDQRIDVLWLRSLTAKRVERLRELADTLTSVWPRRLDWPFPSGSRYAQAREHRRHCEVTSWPILLRSPRRLAVC
jgi:hypothetical protein